MEFWGVSVLMQFVIKYLFAKHNLVIAQGQKMEPPVKIKLTNIGLLIQLANHFITSGTLTK